MTERLCTWSLENLDERGKPTPEYQNLYAQWAQSGTGILVLGNIPVDRRFLEARGNAILDPLSPWDPVPLFEPVFSSIKAAGSIGIAQLTHGGRQTPEFINPHPVSSSDVQTTKKLGGLSFGKPRPMTKSEIEDLVERFAWAAEKVWKAGGDGIQLHAAHGYLLSQFLSPRVNKRTDEYGGSLENRSRIIREILFAIKKRIPDPSFLLTIKINSADFSEGGFSPDESLQMCKWLEEWGIVLIELSGGTYENVRFGDPESAKRESTKRREAFFVEFAERFRPHLKTAKLCVTGGFRSAEGMDEAIRSGACDIVGIGRPLTNDPKFTDNIVSGKIQRAPQSKVFHTLSIFASYAQIEQISRNLDPTDMSQIKNASDMEATIIYDLKGSSSFKPNPMYKSRGLSVWKFIYYYTRPMFIWIQTKTR